MNTREAVGAYLRRRVLYRYSAKFIDLLESFSVRLFDWLRPNSRKTFTFCEMMSQRSWERWHRRSMHTYD